VKKEIDMKEKTRFLRLLIAILVMLFFGLMIYLKHILLKWNAEL